MALPFQLESSAVIRLSAVPFTRNSSIAFPTPIFIIYIVHENAASFYCKCNVTAFVI